MLTFQNIALYFYEFQNHKKIVDRQSRPTIKKKLCYFQPREFLFCSRKSLTTASITGTPENPVLNLGIPKGADGTSGNVHLYRHNIRITDNKNIAFYCNIYDSNDSAYNDLTQLGNHLTTNSLICGSGLMYTNSLEWTCTNLIVNNVLNRKAISVNGFRCNQNEEKAIQNTSILLGNSHQIIDNVIQIY